MCIRDRRPTITRTPATRRLRWLHSETLRPISVQVQAQIVPQRSRNFGLTLTPTSRTGRARQCHGALAAHGQTVPVEVVIDRATNEGDGVRVHAHVEHLDRYAFGVTKVKGFAGRYLDLDLDLFAVPA